VKFPEEAYVSEVDASYPYQHKYLLAAESLDAAFHYQNEGEREIAIYKLVRIAKYKKTVVETKTLEEIACEK